MKETMTTYPTGHLHRQPAVVSKPDTSSPSTDSPAPPVSSAASPGASSAELAAALREAADRLSPVSVESPAMPPARFSSDDPGQRAARLVQQFLGFLEQGDLVSLGDLVSEDLVYRIPGQSRISGVYEGVDGLAAACSIAPRPGVRGLRSELTGLTPSSSGDFVATFHAMTGSLDDQTVEVEIALRFTLRDGRISVITEYCADQYLSDELFAN